MGRQPDPHVSWNPTQKTREKMSVGLLAIMFLGQFTCTL